MSSVDIAVACAVLASLPIYFVFGVNLDASDLAPHRTKLDQLMERRDAIYENLRDLRFEFRAGKFSEAGLRRNQTIAGTGSGAGPRRHGPPDRRHAHARHAPDLDQADRRRRCAIHELRLRRL